MASVTTHRTVRALAAPTAVRALSVPVGGRVVRIRLHLAGGSPFGSVKDRTALALLGSLEESGRLTRGGHVVESTSGNLGIALAGLCAERGYRCSLVVDDVTPPFSLRRMADLGAELIRVRPAPHEDGVRARLRVLHSFRAAHPAAVWTDQYHNPAGPAVHAAVTGPELVSVPGLPAPQAIMIPVSTGGALAGVSRHVRGEAPRIRLWAVDATGSAAVGGGAAARPDKLPGFGSALPSSFLTPGHFDHVAYVGDQDAAAASRAIRARTAISLGGSSGAAALAAVRAASEDPRLADLACLCPDGGDRYEDLIYGAAARRSRPGSDPAVRALTSAAESVL
jgi:N-(2-amino-2-carboxyethyl)-L-glutamate synthase